MAKPDWMALLAMDDGIKVQPGASVDELERCESALGATMPPVLRCLYILSDGIWHEPGQWFVIWPLREVVQRNRTEWELEGPRRQRWIGFGDDGTGSPFCFARSRGDAMYYWSPIDQEETLLADDAASFWTAWTTRALPPH